MQNYNNYGYYSGPYHPGEYCNGNYYGNYYGAKSNNYPNGTRNAYTFTQTAYNSSAYNYNAYTYQNQYTNENIWAPSQVVPYQPPSQVAPYQPPSQVVPYQPLSQVVPYQPNSVAATQQRALYQNNLAPSQVVPYQPNSGRHVLIETKQYTQYTYSDGKTSYRYISQTQNGQVVFQRVEAHHQNTISNDPPNYSPRGRGNAIEFNNNYKNSRVSHYNRPRHHKVYNRRQNYRRNYKNFTPKNHKNRSYYQHDRRTPNEPKAWNYKAYIDNKRRNMVFKKHVCSACSEAFRNENALKKHEEIVHPIAEKENFLDTAAFTAGLSEHSTPLKTEAFIIRCEFCPKKFTTEKSFKRHMETVHTSVSATEKPKSPVLTQVKIKKEKLSLKKDTSM